MLGELRDLDAAIDAAGRVDVDALDVDDLVTVAWRLQQSIDRAHLLHARVLQCARHRRAFTATASRDMADQVSQLTGASKASVNRKLAMADAIDRSPDLQAALTAGEVSVDTAVAIAEAVVTSPDDADLAALVHQIAGKAPAAARREVDLWQQARRSETPEEAADRRFEARSLTRTQPIDGMVITSINLPEFESEIVHATLDALAAQQHHDGDTRTWGQRRADGLVALCNAYQRGEVLGGRSQATVVLHWQLDGSIDDCDLPAVTARGAVVPAPVVRRLLHDAHLQRVLTVGSEILDLGRTQRLASRAQWTALLVRDGGCRVAGCEIPAAWCDVDHLIAWVDGGATDLDDLALLCSFHHAERHRPGARIERAGPDFDIVTPSGHRLRCPLPPPRTTTGSPPGRTGPGASPSDRGSPTLVDTVPDHPPNPDAIATGPPGRMPARPTGQFGSIGSPAEIVEPTESLRDHTTAA